MKLTKFLALGLAALSFTFTSCLSNDDDQDTVVSYTDYFQVKSDGTQCTADDDTSYTIDNSSSVAALTGNLSHGRAFMSFSITYDGTTGEMKGGFQVGGMSPCFVIDAASGKVTSPSASENLITVNANYCSVTSKYLNLYVTQANYDLGNSSTSSLIEDNFKAYVTKVDGNEVYVSVYYDNEGAGTENTVQQPISVSIADALDNLRGSITPDADGKIKVILNNNESVTGTYAWN